MRKEKYVYFQKPNLPLIVWFVSFVFLLLPINGIFRELLSLISFGSIFTWAWLEIFDGVNNFRRSLGLIVMIVVLGIRVF